jgi:hypothetical protein
MSKNWFCELEPNWETRRAGGGGEGGRGEGGRGEGGGKDTCTLQTKN